MRIQQSKATPCRNPEKEPDWLGGLPAKWRPAVLAPLDFAYHREYEMPALRILGYDQDGEPCYYRHAFELGATRSDDDEEFYEALLYGEEVEAWRLRDERWLVRRAVYREEDGAPGKSFYSFSETMPR